jgi:phage baseplate assembly protein W
MARATRQFIDLDAAFTYNPKTRDVASKSDDNAIRGALRNLILSRNYDKPFEPDFGCQLINILFEQLDDFTIAVAERTLYNTITRYEPRVEVLSVEVSPSNTDDNEVYITIIYKNKNTQNIAEFTTTFTRVR